MAVRQQLVWVKDVFVMGRHDYHYRHEPILYGWKEGGAHFFGGGRAQDTVCTTITRSSPTGPARCSSSRPIIAAMPRSRTPSGT
jgi:hypothetical protein